MKRKATSNAEQSQAAKIHLMKRRATSSAEKPHAAKIQRMKRKLTSSAEQPEAVEVARAKLCLREGLSIEGTLRLTACKSKLLYVMEAVEGSVFITLKNPFSRAGTRSGLFQDHAFVSSIVAKWYHMSNDLENDLKEGLRDFFLEGSERWKSMQCYRWCDDGGPKETKGWYIIDVYSGGDGQ